MLTKTTIGTLQIGSSSGGTRLTPNSVNYRPMFVQSQHKNPESYFSSLLDESKAKGSLEGALQRVIYDNEESDGNAGQFMTPD